MSKFIKKLYKNGTEYLFSDSPYVTLGVAIDTGNSNPDTCVTYTDDLSGTTDLGSIDNLQIYQNIRPCLLKDGVRVGYLKKTDFTQWAEGQGLTGTPDITSGAAGDVMIEFPKMGWKIYKTGNIVSVKLTNNPNAGSEGFKYYAHTRDVEGDRNYLYMGAYIGTTIDGVLRSLSGKTCAASQTIGTFRTQAQAHGESYDQQHFYAITLIQILYLMRFRSLQSQTAVGRGYVDANPGNVPTGATNAKGMIYGETTGKLQMKCFGIEDLWGNYWTWVDGLFSDASRNVLTAYKGFNDTGAGYKNCGASDHAANFNAYFAKVVGTSEAGFIAAPGTGGSETTYFCDMGRVYASALPLFGGARTFAGPAGVFGLLVSYAASDLNTNIGSRLMFL